jgi:glycosyltransferase involved in cell wall biosynthesis
MQKTAMLNKKEKFDIVHCRSYISSIIGLQLKRKYGTKFIFDMRGFWIDERIEEGGWNQNNFLYKLVIKYFRRKEDQFYEHSDVIVTLTHASKRTIELIRPDVKLKIHVIPTCVNLDVFKPFDASLRNNIRRKMGIPQDAFVLLYSGGFGANYNISFLLQVYNRIKQDKPEACILILSKDGVTGLEQEKNAGKIFSISLPYSQVGEYLMAGDMGVINYNNHFSVAGRSPTKLAEYWACGLPAIAPKGIGDVDYLFAHYDKSGILYDEATFCHELSATLKVKKEALRSYAQEYFGLDNGAKMYDDIYNNLTAND